MYESIYLLTLSYDVNRALENGINVFESKSFGTKKNLV